MELGELDVFGCCSLIVILGVIEIIDIDMVIVSVGVFFNLIVFSFILGLELGCKGIIVVNENM